jgi:hypothetical protein
MTIRAEEENRTLKPLRATDFESAASASSATSAERRLLLARQRSVQGSSHKNSQPQGEESADWKMGLDNLTRPFSPMTWAPQREIDIPSRAEAGNHGSDVDTGTGGNQVPAILLR